MDVTAEIVSIGTEILLGELTDANSVYIARQLRDVGVNIYYMTSVGDNEQRIVSALTHAMNRAQVIITCGGLGPTVDDMTRQSVAHATERELVFHQYLFDQISERFAGFRVKMTENNRRQAYLPADAIPIENPVGTAPAYIVEHGDNVVISLPGVPREMKYLMQENVLPYLRKKYDLGIIKARILKTAGIGESSLDDLLGDKLLNTANPSIGLAAHSGQIDIRITAKAKTDADADAMIDSMEKRVLERAGQHIFGRDDDVLEEKLVAYAMSKGAKLTVIEAGIDGTLGNTIQQVDASVMRVQQVFESPDALRQAFQQEQGSIREMALEIAGQALHGDVDVVIVIACEPEVDENADIEEGTVVVVHSRENTRSRVYGFGGRSELARRWVSTWSMAAAWQMLRARYE